MGVTWTKEQEKVISLRDRNILVSAAAGSGKTAVLVQRILSMILDPVHPVDIDRLLIMTFTRAAAGEMRERIARALEEALYEDPDNEHLQRQTTLIHTAQITTIDGFCSYVIRNYFHLIGLDPGCKTAEEGELKLLKEDVLKDLMEEQYALGGEAFHQFVECYAGGKTDEGIKDYILDVYEAAMSHPDPQKWLDQCLKVYETETVEELGETEWMKLLWTAAEDELREAQGLFEEAKALCSSLGGPYLYEEALDSDLEFLEILKKRTREKDFDGMSDLLADLSFAWLSGKKMEGVEETKKEQTKALREEGKAILKEMKTRYFLGKEAQILVLLKLCRGPMATLAELVRSFMEQFAEKKREKNLLDFTDMEHFALKILMDEKGEMTSAARELSEKYEEVLVDEYQDSNLVQELLTTCVSGWVKKKKNIFMVGDVKQSIYRFRLARPELFMEKFKRYSLTDSQEQRIDLHKNFRSRPEVLESVNYIFRQIMGEDLGGIGYDEGAALYPGAAFPEGADPEFVKTCVLLIEKDTEELLEEQGSAGAQELEALAIAQEIRRIVGREKVWDKEKGEYRPAAYGDIAVLLRTAYGWAETFSQVFESKGIPAYTSSRTGYFSALEVVTVLNYLRVCDNPLQDIPLAGVLRSPIVGCTAKELAMIRRDFPKGLLYESVCAYVEDGQMELFPEEEGKEALKDKLVEFLGGLHQMRAMAEYTPIHQLILSVIEKTGYGEYARALPGGEQRQANLHMLVEKAMEYEKTSYRGLFNFIRYIESLQKYQVDFGETNISGAGNASVQIMTIHKSKGLEFPIVFAAGMGKQFNFQDMNARLLLHPELGFGADAILPEKRLIVNTLHKQIIRRELLKESLGEELRVLYVALTRAKEKLVITGTISKLEKQIRTLARYQDQAGELLPLGTRLKARSYWAYILPALSRHRCMDALYKEYGIAPFKEHPLYKAEAEFSLVRLTAADLAGEETLQQTEEALFQEMVQGFDPDQVWDEKIREELEKRFGFSYPYGYLKDIPVKVSVSELKKRDYAGDLDKEESLFFERDVVPLIPRFAAGEEEEYKGARRGTAYHRLMECLDYHRVSKEEEIREQIQKLTAEKKMEERQAESISIEDVMIFLRSPLGKRMEAASLRGRLVREQPFVMAVDAKEIQPEWKDGGRVLVQGIIDAYFEEEDGLVLVDYKTDQVKAWEEQNLVRLYHTQLENYQEALEKLLHVKVKEKYIYSFALGKEILM